MFPAFLVATVSRCHSLQRALQVLYVALALAIGC
jgi:hypothetical protein